MSARPRAYVCICGHARSLHEDRQASCSWASARSGVAGSRETCSCEMFTAEGQRGRAYAGGFAEPVAAADPASSGERTELLGLGVLVTVFERLDPGERRRALAYLADRFCSPAEPSERDLTACDARVLSYAEAAYARADAAAAERARVQARNIALANALSSLRSARDELLRRAADEPKGQHASHDSTRWARWVVEVLEGRGDEGLLP